MAVKLRLTRKGKTKQPFYRIVATESSVARDGKYIEKIGHYNPVKNPPEILLDEEKALKWLSHGATPSETVKSIFRKKGLMLKWHLQKSGMPQDKIDEEFKRWELLQIEKTRKEEALRAQQEREDQEKKKKEKEKEKTEAAEKSDVAADAVETAPVEEQPEADAQPEAEATAEEKTADASAAAEETPDEALKEESAPEKAEDQPETPEAADEAKPAQAEAEEKKEKE